METFTFIISQDGKEYKTLTNQPIDVVLYGEMLRAQGNSINHAIRYEGWKIEMINEQTNERFVSKYKDLYWEFVPGA